MKLLQLELLKLRRTLVWPVTFLLPLIPAVLDAFIYRIERFSGSEWANMLNSGLTTWWLLMMPLVVSLFTAQVLGLEHGSGGWRLQFAAPRPRWQSLAAKFALCFLLLAIATALVAITVGLGALTNAARLTGTPDWLGFAGTAGLGLIGTFCFLALTFFVALRFSSFLAPLGVGLIGMLLGFVGINSPAFGPWWPWTFPLLLSSPVSNFDMTGPILFNAALTAAFLALSLWQIQRRDA